MNRYVAIIFSDLKGYSTIKDNRLLRKIEELNTTIKTTLLNAQNHFFVNTWGDAFYICSYDCYDAASIALKMRDFIKSTNWEKEGFAQKLEIRIGVHFANVDIIEEQGKVINVIGKEISSGARIEPIVAPNSVWCSKIFYDNLMQTGFVNIQGYHLGEKALAKNFGAMNLVELIWEHEPKPESIKAKQEQLENRGERHGRLKTDRQIWGEYYALIIGINEYSEWSPLHTAVKDAVTLRDILIANYEFPEEHVLLKTNQHATRSTLIHDLRALASQLRETDNLLVYFAGHGQLDPLTDEGFWIPVDGRADDLSTWVANSMVKTILCAGKVRGKNIAVVADSCYSGSLCRGGPPLSPHSAEQYQRTLPTLASRRSRQVITSGGVEPVEDGGRDGHSLFAYYLLNALQENEKPACDLEHLVQAHVSGAVKEISGQSPNIGRFKTPMDEDGQFVLVKAPRREKEAQLDSVCLSEEFSPPRPYQNLIPRHYTEFIGRDEELAKLLRFLSPTYGLNIITVDGIGGVGKTSLVLEAAYRCVEASQTDRKTVGAEVPTFDAIIFTSAKQDALTAGGILPRHQAQRTLHDIFYEISHTLDRPDIIRAMPDDQAKRVRESLIRQKTLLIVDNLETIEDKQGILAFLYELPANVKVVITTRERQSITPIRLTELPEVQGLHLIERHAHDMGVELNLSQKKRLYQEAGGIPAAIIYAIGQISSGYTVQTVLKRIRSATGDIARFCFQNSVIPLRGKPAHHLLMAIAIFPKSPVRAALAAVAGYGADPITVEEELVQLQRLSLVTQAEGRYSLLPLTREYALAELAAHRDFERKARERWAQWYMNLARKYGVYKFRDEWHIHYDQLENEWENIQEVLNWYADHERYDDYKKLWGFVERYTDLYGCWSDRLNCLDWLIQASERRGDFSTLVEQLFEKGSVLQDIGQLEEATSLCTRAWKLQEHIHDLTIRLRLIKANADNQYLRKNYEEALQWVERGEQIIANTSLKGREKHEELGFLFRRGQIYYEVEDYEGAEKLFQRIKHKAQSLNWQRAFIFAQKWLANISLAKGDLNLAESLLESSFPVAIRNKDKRAVAFYKRSFAYLAQKRDDYKKMRHWAREALKDFERLGIILHADEMRDLLESGEKIVAGQKPDSGMSAEQQDIVER